MSARVQRAIELFLISLLIPYAFLLFTFEATPSSGDDSGYPGMRGEPTSTFAPYPIGTPVYYSAGAAPTAMAGTRYHLPIVDRAVPVQFSLAGGEDEHVAAVVSVENFSLPPYRWAKAPDSENTTQMINRCGGTQEQYWCWIVPYAVTDYPSGKEYRSNIADISTPNQYPPEASSSLTGCLAGKGTDGDLSTMWMANNESTAIFTISDLHKMRLDEIVLDWYEDKNSSCANQVGVYAKQYNIKVKKTPGGAWTPIYSTSNGLGGRETLDTDDFENYNNEYIYAITLQMTGKPASPLDNYALKEFEVYGEAAESLFNRAYSGLDLAGWAGANPGELWLIGNEPDNYDIVHGDAISPTTYGEFYGEVAKIIKGADPTANLLFCQGTKAETPATPSPSSQFPHYWGWNYCEQALAAVESALSGSGLSLTSAIDGVSIHQYTTTKIVTTPTPNRQSVIADWIAKLEEFQAAVNASAELAGKPLYLTEYGDADNRCIPATPTPAGTMPTTVTPTPTTAPGCGAMGEGTAWYGRNREEGYWALTHYMTDYFLNTCQRQTGCNSQWVGVWWFKAGDDLIEDLLTPACD